MKPGKEKEFERLQYNFSLFRLLYFGMLSEGLNNVSFFQLIADALLTSDIYIFFAPKNKSKRFSHNIL